MEYKDFNISNLTMWKDNARFNYEVSTEKECIENIFNDNKLAKKTKKLLDDILQKEYILETFIVYEDNFLGQKQYIVLDGNRRISLFKILDHADLISKYKLHESKLKILNDKIKAVKCQVYLDLNQAYEHVKKRHLGEQDGAGVVGWNSENKDRMNVIASGVSPKSIGYKIMEFYNNNNLDAFQYVKKNIKDKSTIDRIFKSKSISSDVFGLNSFNEYDLTDNNQINKVNEILTEFYSDDGKVSSVYTKDQIKDRFSNIVPLNSTPQLPLLDTKTLNDDSPVKSQINRNPNSYKTARKLNVFNWKNSGIKSKNSVFCYYLNKAVNLTDYNGYLSDQLLFDFVPYLFRLLLDIALKDLINYIQSGNLNAKIKNNAYLTSFITSSTLESAVSFNKIIGLLDIYNDLRYQSDKDKIKDSIKVLSKKKFNQKNSANIQHFITDINEVIHGFSLNLNDSLLEKYDEITLNLLKIIYELIS